MSETVEQPTTKASEPRWGDPISAEQKVELQGYVDRWKAEADHGERKGPFDGIRLTGADISWLAEQSGRNSDGGALNLHLEGAELLRAHLAGASLHAAHLEGANLCEAHLEGADLWEAHLEGAHLNAAHLERARLSMALLEGANLRLAYLERAFLQGTHLEHADLGGARLKEAHLTEAQLVGASLQGTHLEHAILSAADMTGANLFRAHLEHAVLTGAQLARIKLLTAHLEHADLSSAHLEHADLDYAHLEHADLSSAYLQHASLCNAYLEGARLSGAHLEGVLLGDACLKGTYLTGASFDKTCRLNNVKFADAFFDQVVFDNANLTVVDWSLVTILGDEHTARKSRDANGMPKTRALRLEEYKAAVRANRVLSVNLQAQGLAEDGDRFAYQAKKLQRPLLRLQRKYGAYLFSWVLAGLAGYGYRLRRIFIVYGIAVLLFAAGYFLAGGVTDPTHPHAIFSLQQQALNALQVSLNAIHGRVFFTQLGLDTLQSWLATLESIVGIVIEGVFVAMLIQRFFAR